MPQRCVPRGSRCLPLVGVALVALSFAGVAGPAAGTATSADWTLYHHDPEGHGVAGPIRLAGAHRVWVSRALDGQLYGEPLVAGTTVIVATEDDTVYALNAANGKVRWSTHVGTPVAASALPCGDVAPTVGITSTPAIDTARGEVFVVADVAGRHGPAHELVGLRLSSGAVELRQGVDPSGIDTSATLQRVALTLDSGRVVFGFGGNYGDCSTYHGWVVSVPEAGGPIATYEIDPAAGDDQGAVWMGGAAPEVGAGGDIWFAAGNGSVDTAGRPYDGSDSVVELTPALRLVQYFAPSDWASDNAHDRDLGSSAPTLLGDGLAVQAGKSDTAYLLSQSKLGGVGGQLATLGSFCGMDVDGGAAVVGDIAYEPCEAGVEAVVVSTSPPSLRVLWRASDAGGPPIVAGGFVWTMSQNGDLDAFNRLSGAMRQHLSIGSVANHFPTPSVGDGRLLAPGFDRVYAFAGS